MTRVLLVGQIPETVDYSDPALPPGLDAQKVHAGLAVACSQMVERGWTVDQCMVQPDDSAGPTLAAMLGETAYDCVVIGAGVRNPPRNLHLLEVLINAIHRGAPGATIAFNTRPDDSAQAAARWLPPG